MRAQVNLTQEELAEAVGLSPRSLSDLERGVNRSARKDTAVLLADTLCRAEPTRARFVAAARGLLISALIVPAASARTMMPRLARFG